jgi:anthranilate phosphoribosyltransferase
MKGAAAVRSTRPESGSSGREAISPSLRPPFVETLGRLADGVDLTREEAALALEQIIEGEASEVQAAAFLMALRVKGETADEIAGLAETTRRMALRVVTDEKVLVDTAGTGGDGLHTFNISTTAAFVAAGAGVKIAKHGNRAASSRSGSADMLEALGVRIDLNPEQIATCLKQTGIGFMFAPLHHRAAGRVSTVRKALGVRTVFNFLGPLTNPAGARRQLVGVSAPAHLDLLAGALSRMGCERALVVHGEEGLDELSVCGPTTVVEVLGARLCDPYTVEPEKVGLVRRQLAELAGGDATDNAALTQAILRGARGGPRDVVLLNAAGALYVAGAASSIATGLDLARDSIDSGRAARVLERLVDLSRRFSPAAEAVTSSAFACRDASLT